MKCLENPLEKRCLSILRADICLNLWRVGELFSENMQNRGYDQLLIYVKTINKKQNIIIWTSILCHSTMLIGLEGRVLASSPEDLGLIPGRVIPKTFKTVLDTSLLNTQQYKVSIKSKVEQPKERSSALPLHPDVVAIEKGAFRLPSTMVANYYNSI